GIPTEVCHEQGTCPASRSDAGGPDLPGRRVSADDVLVAEWLALAAKSAGIRTDDSRGVRDAGRLSADGFATPRGASQPHRFYGLVEPGSRRHHDGAGIIERRRARASAGRCSGLGNRGHRADRVGATEAFAPIVGHAHHRAATGSSLYTGAGPFWLDRWIAPRKGLAWG